MTLWYLPLEPIENRYTKEWWWQYDKVFKEKGIKFDKIPYHWPTVKTDGKNFLDWGNSFAFKYHQLYILFRGIKDGDAVFVADGEFPGLEALEYYRKMSHVNFKIYSIWHAGTYDVNDLTYKCGLEPIGKPLENILFNICDKVFLATEAHKKLILSKRDVPKSKLVVTGLPLDVMGLSDYRQTKKNGKIIFGGRLSDEKGYDIVQQLIKRGYDIDVAMLKGYSKKQWYKALASAKVLFAPSLQETFGYNTVEAMAVGTRMVVSNAACFKEYVPKEMICKQHTVDAYAKALDKALAAEDTPLDQNGWQYTIEKYHYKNCIGKMVNIMSEK